MVAKSVGLSKIEFIILCIILVCLTFITNQLATPIPAKSLDTVSKKLSITLLGDSYSAGNGAGSYYGKEGSYLSSNNWAHGYARWLAGNNVHTTLNSAAFSGYTTQQVIDTQIADVPNSTDLVMLTVGGNDADFAKVVEQCFALGFRDSKTCKEKVGAARSKIPDILKNTKKIFEKLDEKLPDTSQIVLVSYPLLSMDKHYVLSECSASQFGIATDCRDYDVRHGVRALGRDAAAAQKKLVDEWNKTRALKATFVDTIQSSFSGHEPDPSVLSRNDYRWINEFFETEGRRDTNGKTASGWSGDNNTWYHPNIIGHQKIADAIAKKIGIPKNAHPIAKDNSDIDIAFVIDTTGSMGGALDSVKEDVASTVSSIKAASKTARFALVDYKDHPGWGGDSTDYPAKLRTGFTSDTEVFADKLAELSVEGGGDWPESVYSGMMKGMDLDWRPGVRKIMIVVGDAPPHDPEPVTSYTADSVILRSLEIDPVVAYGIDTSGLADDSFSKVVEGTGGQTIRTSSSNVPDAILSSIEISASKPFAWIQGPYVAKVGSTLTLDARGSYATVGTLTKYEWDFDGDGDYDAASSRPLLTRKFTELYGGTLALRVTDSTGRTELGSTRLDITDDGDTIPRARDNCPDIANLNQSDYDNDGIGDDCDRDSGYPTKDKPGVYEIGEDGVARQYGFSKPLGSEPQAPGVIAELPTSETNEANPEKNTAQNSPEDDAAQAAAADGTQTANDSTSLPFVALVAAGIILAVGGAAGIYLYVKSHRS